MAWSDKEGACAREPVAPQFAAEDPRCEACASGVLRARRVDMACWAGERLFVVRDVPALVCDACGERYTEDSVALRLDLMRGSGFRGAREVGRKEVSVLAYPGGEDAEG